MEFSNILNETAGIPVKTITELCKDLQAQAELVAEKEAELKVLKAKYDDIEVELFDLMVEEEVQNLKVGGKQFIMVVKTRYNAVSDAKPTLYKKLRARKLGSLITSTINANTLSSAVKNIVDENGGSLPKWLDGLVQKYDQKAVQIRKA